MEMKEKQSKTQKSGFEGVGDESAEINLETLPEMAAKTYSQAARRRNGQQEATIVSRIFCCLRLIHSNNVNVARNVGSRADQYLAAADSSSSTAGNKLRDSKEQPQQQYSWLEAAFSTKYVLFCV
jgi:hypothetical protein